ncbi:MAG: hypothetical protein ACXWEI_07815, partial [Mycobacterium sp.]
PSIHASTTLTSISVIGRNFVLKSGPSRITGIGVNCVYVESVFDALSRIALAAIAAPLLSLTACNFSVSAGGPDYDKLEKSISDELKGTYSTISPNAPTVTCPREQDVIVACDSGMRWAGLEDKLAPYDRD